MSRPTPVLSDEEDNGEFSSRSKSGGRYGLNSTNQGSNDSETDEDKNPRRNRQYRTQHSQNENRVKYSSGSESDEDDNSTKTRLERNSSRTKYNSDHGSQRKQNDLECPLCNERFDDSSRRPRNMPCGHGFCSLCVNTIINKGSKACPVCRMDHTAKSATDLPVSFLLEELLHNSTISAEEDEVEMCSEHKKIPLYFHCKSHGIKVCHSCTVLAHQPTTCNLISLNDLIEEKKEVQITNVQNQKQVLENAEKDFKLVLKENVDNVTDQQKKKQEVEKEIQKALLEIENIQQDIIKKENYQKQVKVAIQGCQDKQKTFEIMKNRLMSVTSNREVEAESKDSTNAIMQSQKWEETQRRELDVSTKLNAVKVGGELKVSFEKYKSNSYSKKQQKDSYATTFKDHRNRVFQNI